MTDETNYDAIARLGGQIRKNIPPETVIKISEAQEREETSEGFIEPEDLPEVREQPHP